MSGQTVPVLRPGYVRGVNDMNDTMELRLLEQRIEAMSDRISRLEEAVRMLNRVNPMPTHRRVVEDVLDASVDERELPLH